MATLKDKLAPYRPAQPYIMRKALSVAEKGKRYSIAFSPGRLSAVYQVDGDIIKEGSKCDKLIVFTTDDRGQQWTEVFVELKGCDIAHAIEQLEATLNYDAFKHPTVQARAARIVGRSIPRNTSNSILERARNRFSKGHRCNLRAVSPGTTEKF